MTKATGLPLLNLGAHRGHDAYTPGTLSPRSVGSPRSPRSVPGSPRLEDSSMTMMQQVSTQEPNTERRFQNGRSSPQITAMPELPPSPVPGSPKHARDPSKSFFSNFIASRSSHKLQNSEPNIVEGVERSSVRSRASSKDRTLHTVRRQESTPDLPRVYNSNGTSQSPQNSQETVAPLATSQMGSSEFAMGRKGKPKFGSILLARTKTLKQEETVNKKGQKPSQLQLDQTTEHNDSVDAPLKTAPIRSDHREIAFTNENGSSVRNRSADRQQRDEHSLPKRERQGSVFPGAMMFSNLGHSGKGAADRLGKAGKGIFGKIARSGSSTVEREAITDDNYVCTTIGLPLVKQTRKTRIARRLELSKDKTEFWMPALPWRCIDYLNMNGCEEEGLYRIPGSGRDVKHWQRRFDTEYDINLFDEPDLYDINTIGSMFKSWLRELPDEILPKAVQNKIASECAGATRTPQVLKDELSKLPPFNYYLLFAITCHLSLLNSFADKNKMDYRNLCICFQPCLRIDAFCFQFLVMDWKSCWQGCWTEKEYLEEEYRYEKEGSINESEDLAVDDRAISSSGSSQHMTGPPKSSDGTQQRSGSLSKSKQRSLSNSTDNRTRSNSNHATAQSMPSVPRIVTTPEPKIPDQLPEVPGLSPIRM